MTAPDEQPLTSSDAAPGDVAGVPTHGAQREVDRPYGDETEGSLARDEPGTAGGGGPADPNAPDAPIVLPDSDVAPGAGLQEPPG